MSHWNCVERPMSRFFGAYGRLVASSPWPFIVIPLIVTATLSLGFLHMDIITDAVYLFVPTNSIAKYERLVIHEKWPLIQNTYLPGRAVTQTRECQLIARARNNGNILQQQYADAVLDLNRHITNDVVVKFEGREYRYTDLCLHWRDNPCAPNIQISMVNGLYSAGMNVTFPTHRPKPGSDDFLENFIGSVYLGSSMGGVRYTKENDSKVLNLYYANAWLMLFHIQFQPDNMSYISSLWEQEYARTVANFKSPYLEVTYFHSQTLTEELKRNADTLVPKFILTFTILVGFSMVCSLVFMPDTCYIDWVLSKPILALFCIITAAMSMVCSIGLLTFLGSPYNQIVNVMPFLVVSLACDNMFIMSSGLRRTDRSLSISDRMSEMLTEAGVSITITCTTNALSFFVGCITSIPAVLLFCLYTGMAILLCFIFQLTFFLGIFVLFAKLEEQGRHSVTRKPTVNVPMSIIDKLSLKTRILSLGSRVPLGDHKTLDGAELLAADKSISVRFFRDWYGPILMESWSRALVVFWYGVYLGIGLWGCLSIREGLEPINLLVSDSYAIPHYRWLEELFWRYGTEVQIVVNNAPDLTDPDERQKIWTIANSFADNIHTIGVDGLQFWLSEFESHMLQVHPDQLTRLDTSPRTFYTYLRSFFDTHTRWEGDVYYNNPQTRDRITAFRFVVGMREFSSTRAQQAAAAHLRELATNYPTYNITTFMPIWLFVDQYNAILPNTLQDIAVGMACMLSISLLLIPQPLCALWVAVSIASIAIGVIGYMTWWSVNLDAISMITIVMSMGFSVDYSAHITYCYVCNTDPNLANRISQSLAALGAPVLQGGISTIVGVAVLAGVNAYMIVTFFKTVFLVITIGLMHGLIFLPVFLSLFVRRSGSSLKVELKEQHTSAMKLDRLNMGTRNHS